MISALANLTILSTRAKQYERDASQELSAGVDRMMAWLLGLEWLGLMSVAAIRAPFAWEGAARHWNPHFLASILAGPAFIIPCIWLAVRCPAKVLTRHCVAAAQMLVSVLLIDITGGRIETHFHVFGSLAFLAFYRDWRVLVTASAISALDHVIRGFWYPQAIYGITTVSPYRWLEHVGWVLFEDFFLFLAIQKSIQESHELASSKSLLYEGAYHDVLTGLGNRRLLSEKFESFTQRSPAVPSAMLFVDLDRFKQVNDIHGHTVGDKLLLEVANRLTNCLSAEATLARIGGDEFNVLLHGVTEAQAFESGSLLLQSLTAPFTIENHELMLSATVGISLYPDHGRTLAILQQQADEAMYAAKANGRNQIQVYSEQAKGKKERLEDLTRDLFDAESLGQLHLNFQPLVARAGEVSSFEALLRWSHPKYGLVPPIEFIPLAERSGLILKIGEWVLVEACRECKSWQKGQFAPLGVAVNVSALQFEQRGFPGRIEQILGDACLSPSLLTLELTESILIRDVPQARKHLNGLRALGVNVALDDFGTGYSSLSYLSELPADSIKLDRSFVQHEFGKQSSVVESIIAMAHKIGLRVVAEGVETQAEENWLLSLKCDALQGYKFSRPIPAVLVLQYLAERLAGTQRRIEEIAPELVTC